MGVLFNCWEKKKIISQHICNRYLFITINILNTSCNTLQLYCIKQISFEIACICLIISNNNYLKIEMNQRLEIRHSCSLYCALQSVTGVKSRFICSTQWTLQELHVSFQMSTRGRPSPLRFNSERTGIFILKLKMCLLWCVPTAQVYTVS